MKFSGMICHHIRTNRSDLGIDQVRSQGQGYKGVKNYWTELHEIFRDDLSSSKDQLIRFCGNQVKGQGQAHEKPKTYFCHNTHFSSDSYETMPKCSLFNSLSFDR